MSSNSPSIKLFLFSFLCLYFLTNLLKIIFLLKGKIKRNPIMSVAKPGIIKSKAAKAIAAPEIISYAGASFLLS